MLDWITDYLALIMFFLMFFIIFCGYPVAFVMGGMGLAFGFIGWLLGVFPINSLSNVLLRMWGGVATDPVLVSVPMFIFMGSILERSGSAKDMLLATEILLKRVPGGLAVSVMVMGTILAAPIGVVGAAVVLLSLIALPHDAAGRLRQATGDRHHRFGGNARHSHPAGDHARGHGGDVEHFGRRPVRGRHHAGPSAVRALSSLHLGHCRCETRAKRPRWRLTSVRRHGASSGGPCGPACFR